MEFGNLDEEKSFSNFQKDEFELRGQVTAAVMEEIKDEKATIDIQIVITAYIRSYAF